jgi:topoisomerase IA-like protein
MSTATEQMINILIDRYGPFLSIDQLAEALDRSPKGLRITLQRANSAVTKEFKHARKKVGRRVYFNAVGVAQIMIEGAVTN